MNLPYSDLIVGNKFAYCAAAALPKVYEYRISFS